MRHRILLMPKVRRAGVRAPRKAATATIRCRSTARRPYRLGSEL